ncbi:uncharacterized protein SPSK_07558 [Sporothrix schenckii 1099-18]|uniref:Uncharacterized protein n=1 Tax=Sporothrix schenckii 1099-18 TaxID=1397361 RepID=A0A0F2MHM0_SPOSC|nr:uncharacterized protein SPSK_07558 [Sporothrix schenckii 1099-18]KJR87666.1 hypothetical protein SPSK_07558 [Sporothrix schenckii 1099-18]
MRFGPLVAVFASAAVAAVPPAREAQATRVKGRDVDDANNVDNADHNEHCPHDNLLRCLIGSPTLAYTFCSWSVGIFATPVTLYETVTVPVTRGTLTRSTTETTETTETTWMTISSASSPTSSSSTQSTPVGLSTITVTQTATQTVIFDRTQTTTDTLVQTIVQTIVATTTIRVGSDSWGKSGDGGESLAGSLTSSLANATATVPNPPSRVDRRANFARTTPKTSLACLDELQPLLNGVTSACSCFASNQPTPTATSTVTYVEGAPACPAGQVSVRDGGIQTLHQPTFPNCFADFHPYNCGTDHVGQIACSCALTTEDTAQCTLGDYERDNACTTSDDCAAGWYCTVIDCFGNGVPSVCTKACPVIFAPQPIDGSGGATADDGASNDEDVASAHPQHAVAPPAQTHALDAIGLNHRHNLSIIIVGNDTNSMGNGRARGGTYRRSL